MNRGGKKKKRKNPPASTLANNTSSQSTSLTPSLASSASSSSSSSSSSKVPNAEQPSSARPEMPPLIDIDEPSQPAPPVTLVFNAKPSETALPKLTSSATPSALFVPCDPSTNLIVNAQSQSLTQSTLSAFSSLPTALTVSTASIPPTASTTTTTTSSSDFLPLPADIYRCISQMLTSPRDLLSFILMNKRIHDIIMGNLEDNKDPHTRILFDRFSVPYMVVLNMIESKTKPFMLVISRVLKNYLHGNWGLWQLSREHVKYLRSNIIPERCTDLKLLADVVSIQLPAQQRKLYPLFDQKGTLIKIGMMKYGRKEGLWKTFTTGTDKQTWSQEYENGLQTGREIEHKNNLIVKIVPYKNGVPHGVALSRARDTIPWVSVDRNVTTLVEGKVVEEERRLKDDADPDDPVCKQRTRYYLNEQNQECVLRQRWDDDGFLVVEFKQTMTTVGNNTHIYETKRAWWSEIGIMYREIVNDQARNYSSNIKYYDTGKLEAKMVCHNGKSVEQEWNEKGRMIRNETVPFYVPARTPTRMVPDEISQAISAPRPMQIIFQAPGDLRLRPDQPLDYDADASIRPPVGLRDSDIKNFLKLQLDTTKRK